MSNIHVTTKINGDPTEYLCAPDETLLDVLRDRLGMTGSKEGCGTGDCGACSVTVNGRLVCSCLMLGAEAEGTEIETPRYRELTRLLHRMALDGAEFIEIAGNDDIMLTAIGNAPRYPGALHSFPRQGYGDTRHLIAVKVRDLARTLRDMQSGDLTLEHVHDY